jgi:hypothetical protein
MVASSVSSYQRRDNSANAVFDSQWVPFAIRV